MTRVSATLLGGLAVSLGVSLLIAFVLPTAYRGPVTWGLGIGYGVTIILSYAVFMWIALRYRGAVDSWVLSGLAKLSLGFTLIFTFIRPAWLDEVCAAETRCQSWTSGLAVFFLLISLTFSVAAPLAARRVEKFERIWLWIAVVAGAIASVISIVAGFQ
jgi:hypothetical protein